MIYLIIDTNIWVYLANGLDISTKKHSDAYHFKLLDELKQLKDKKEICIIVNDVVFEEWKRNKKSCESKMDKLKNKAKCSESIFGDIAKYSGSDIDQLKSEYTEGLKTGISVNEKHIQNVEDFLFNDCLKVEISDKTKVEIFDLSIERKAPFHNNKNNIADASVLFSAFEYLKNHKDKDENRVIFVSNNIKEFADSENNNEFHPDIKDKVKSINIEYSRVLPDALNISKGILTQIKAYEHHQEWLDSVMFYCNTPYCEANKDFMPWGHLDSKISVIYELMDSRQTELFPYMPKVPRRGITQIGSCVVCESLHFVCPECGGLPYVEYLDESDFECIECNASLSFIYDDSEFGMCLMVNK